MVTITKALIVDIDGTLANAEHRLHYIRDEQGGLKADKNWHAFHAACIDDEPFKWCLDMVTIYKKHDYAIFLMTGRGAEHREATLSWLKKYRVPFDELYMRGVGDHREDSVVKKELYRFHIEDDYRVEFVLEDRKSVVAMWREVGLTCLQCAPGDF